MCLNHVKTNRLIQMRMTDGRCSKTESVRWVVANLTTLGKSLFHIQMFSVNAKINEILNIVCHRSHWSTPASTSTPDIHFSFMLFITSVHPQRRCFSGCLHVVFTASVEATSDLHLVLIAFQAVRSSTALIKNECRLAASWDLLRHNTENILCAVSTAIWLVQMKWQVHPTHRIYWFSSPRWRCKPHWCSLVSSPPVAFYRWQLLCASSEWNIDVLHLDYIRYGQVC